MGIKDFYKHLKSKCPESFVPTDYSVFEHQRIALDMMNILYVYKARDEYNWMRRVIEFMIYLRNLKVHPICVFDGQSHPLKQNTVEKRRSEREKGKERAETLSQSLEQYRQTQVRTEYFDKFLETHPDFISKLTGRPILSQIEHYLQKLCKNYSLHFRTAEIEGLKKILHALGIIVIDAEHDGEALCSQLSENGQVATVISNDSDVFFFGCNQVLFKFTEQGGYLIKFTDILQVLGLTKEEFIDLCLLCGTDFNTSIRGIGFCRALALIQRYKTIDHPDFPFKDQLDFCILEKIRLMREPVSCPELEYCRPIDTNLLEQLLFQYQIEGIKIRQWETAKIEFVETNL
jgi:flap endonuclease-1